MSDKLNIMNLSASGTSKRMKSRAADISAKCNINTFELDRLSNGWPESSKDQLLKLVKKVRDEPFSLDNAFTDVTAIKRFLFKNVPSEPRSNRVPSDSEIKDWLTPSLGHCAISSLPRIDLGAPNQQAYRKHVEQLGYGASSPELDLARYERLSAFGVTYASMFVKQAKKQYEVDSSGKRKYAGPSLLIWEVLGNNNLDKFVGPFNRKTQRRSLSNVPKEWIAEQKTKVDAYVEAVKKRRRKGGNARLPKQNRQTNKKHKAKLPNSRSKPAKQAAEPLPDSLMEWKNKQLRQRLQDLKLPYSGTKEQMVERLNKHGYGGKQ